MANILVNGLVLNDRFTGVQYYIENLLRAMNNISRNSININLLTAAGYQGSVQSGSGIHVLPTKIDSRNRVNRIYFENFKLRRFVKRKTFDIYHSPTYLLPFSPPLPSILTVHDLIAIDHPEYSKNETVLYHRILQRRSLVNAKKVIAVSHLVKNDIIRNYNIPGEKISVVYHGVNPIFKKVVSLDQLSRVKKKYTLPVKYILFVGNIEPKKNLARLFKAYDLIRRNSEVTHKLVIAGKIGWKCRSIMKTLEELRLENDIFFLGYVDEQDLPSIYSLADLFVFPSLYEGFGIPPLEAMACQTPVLISKTGALPEVTGNVCEQVNPLDIKEIAGKIVEMLSDENLKHRSIAAGTKWVKDFTWEKAAHQTLNLYEETLKSFIPQK